MLMVDFISQGEDENIGDSLTGLWIKLTNWKLIPPQVVIAFALEGCAGDALSSFAERLETTVRGIEHDDGIQRNRIREPIPGLAAGPCAPLFGSHGMRTVDQGAGAACGHFRQRVLKKKEVAILPEAESQKK